MPSGSLFLRGHTCRTCPHLTQCHVQPETTTKLTTTLIERPATPLKRNIAAIAPNAPKAEHKPLVLFSSVCHWCHTHAPLPQLDPGEWTLHPLVDQPNTSRQRKPNEALNPASEKVVETHCNTPTCHGVAHLHAKPHYIWSELLVGVLVMLLDDVCVLFTPQRISPRTHICPYGCLGWYIIMWYHQLLCGFGPWLGNVGRDLNHWVSWWTTGDDTKHACLNLWFSLHVCFSTLGGQTGHAAPMSKDITRNRLIGVADSTLARPT